MSRILVIGMGRSGKCATQWLQSLGHEVIGYDAKEGIDAPCPVSSEVNWEGIESAIVSPGIALEHPVYREALARGIPVRGEAEAALSSLSNRIIGVTGTNGKTTLVSFLAHVLNQAGKKAVAIGNIGEPFSSFAASADHQAIVIAELSSFQLETLKGPLLDDAVWLNLTPDHLDRYQTMEEYGAAKKRIRACLKPGAHLYLPQELRSFFPSDDPAICTFSESSYLQVWKSAQYWQGRERFALTSALIIATHLGVSSAAFWQGVETFTRPEHRMECVAEIGGVAYVNDSKGTNLSATVHAVESIGTDIVLIAGGVLKEPSFRPWIAAFGPRVKTIVAMGKSGMQIERELSEQYTVVRVENIQEAVRESRKHAKSGDTVLLSPGCASFDLFANFEERGKAFKNEVRGLV